MNLPDLRIDKVTVEFSHVSGEVLGAKKWSETHVGGGGGSTDSQGRTYVAPVTSTVTTRGEIWIREDGTGKDHLVRHNVPVLAGQRATAVSSVWRAGARSIQSGNMIFVNHSAGRYWLTYTDDQVWGAPPFWLNWLFVVGLMGLALFGLVASISVQQQHGLLPPALALLLPIGAFWLWVKMVRRRSRRIRALDEHTRRLAELILQRGGRIGGP